MSDIRYSIEQLPEPEKSIGKLLIEFHETMRSLYGEGGKKATKIVMTINDVQKIVDEYAELKAEEAFDAAREYHGSKGMQSWEYSTFKDYQQFKNKL